MNEGTLVTNKITILTLLYYTPFILSGYQKKNKKINELRISFPPKEAISNTYKILKQTVCYFKMLSDVNCAKKVMAAWSKKI